MKEWPVTTIEELKEVCGVVAELVANNALLQPVFDRLDRELKQTLAKSKLTPAQALAMRRREVRELA